MKSGSIPSLAEDHLDDDDAPWTAEEQREHLMRFAASLDLINKREADELNRLMADPSMYNVAQSLADGFLAAVDYLCNYKTIIGGNGQPYDIMEAIDYLKSETGKTFEKLTGKPYLPPIARQMRARADAKID